MFTSYGLFSVVDTGAPAGVENYKTVILTHGYGWHAGIFHKVPPFAHKHNARVVLVNRRDFPGTTHFTEEEFAPLLTGLTPTPEGAVAVRGFLKARAKEFYDFLTDFIVKEKIPKEGGVTLATWSFGVTLLTAVLTYAPEFQQGEINLLDYIREVVNYDPPYLALGYPHLEGGYTPFADPSLTPDQGAEKFPAWVSGHYAHGETVATLELRNPLTDPPPTSETMTPEDVALVYYPKPGNPGGSDAFTMVGGMQHGVFEEQRKKALFFESREEVSPWDALPLKHIWCDRTVWAAPWTKYCLEEEVEKAKTEGKRVRPVSLVRVKGANHVLHWEQPERCLLVLLGDEAAAESA